MILFRDINEGIAPLRSITWWCEGCKGWVENTKAIVNDDNTWRGICTCDNEAHAAEALARHQRSEDIGGTPWLWRGAQ